MTKNYLSLRSEISKAKNLGSAGHGSHHWLMQRFAALIMVPLLIWLVYFIYEVAGQEKEEIMAIARLPYNLIALNMLMAAAIYHSTLGMQVIIEDYVNNLMARNAMIIGIKLLSFITIFLVFGASVYFLVQR